MFYGYIPNTPAQRSQIAHISALLGSGAPVSTEVRWDKQAGVPNDQRRTSSCVGNANQKALNTRLAIISCGAEDFSAKAIYDFARMASRTTPTEPLQDQGCVPAFAITGMRTWGVPHQSEWPLAFDDNGICANINEEPPINLIMESAKYILQGAYAIHAEGAERIRAIRGALEQGYPLSFGTSSIDEAYERANDDTVISVRSGPSVGGHMQACVGYKKLPTGRCIFRVIGSWGTDWADGGFCWVDEAFMCSPETDDFSALTAQLKG